MNVQRAGRTLLNAGLVEATVSLQKLCAAKILRSRAGGTRVVSHSARMTVQTGAPCLHIARPSLLQPQKSGLC